MSKYSHLERLQMIFAGEKPDRHAASFWRHFFHMEDSAEGLAEAMLYFQKKFDWDFMKINPRADFHVEDWGLVQEYSKKEFVKHTKTKFPINSVNDWDKIEELEITAPVLSELLSAVSMIRKKSDRELPLLMTVFTPLAIAGRMVDDDQMLADHLRSHPEKIKRALEAITRTYIKFVEELRNAGADGIFYATTQWAAGNLINWNEYKEFGLPYDLPVIEAAGEDAINLFHVCSSNNYLKELSNLDYRSKMINWDSDDPTNIPLDKGIDFLDKPVVVGGCDRNGWLLKGAPHEMAYQVDRLKEMADPTSLIIGPGCSIPPETPMENLAAIREAL
ncbi:MAG: uroporphyrinogen decarboxylase family protein [bacterium]|nr:uroporphyrinogen decarboxylase family protein [bacterium]